MEAPRLFSLSIKKFFIPAAWVLFFILSFRVLARYPIKIFEVLFIVVIALSLLILAIDVIQASRKTRFNYLHVFFFILSILPLISAQQAQQIFGQPFLLGIGAQRSFYIIYSGFLIVVALKKGWVRIEQIYDWFILSLFIMMAAMLYFNVFIDPLKFSNTEFVEYSSNKGWHYEFPANVASALIIFSAIRFFQVNSMKHLFSLVLSSGYFLVYQQDRSQIVALCVTLLIYFLRNLRLQRKLVLGFTGILSAIILVNLISLIRPEFVDHYLRIFTNASTVVLGGETTEYSSNMRIAESAIALDGFKRHPWFGNGVVTSHFRGGFTSFFGYFYASDVGILGNLFVYGIIGTAMLYLFYVFSLRWSIQIKGYSDDFLTLCQYILVFAFFDMFTDAFNLKFIGLLSFAFCIVYYYRFIHIPSLLEAQATTTTDESEMFDKTEQLSQTSRIDDHT